MILSSKQREQWLERRRGLVMASEWYSILFGSALSVYEKKVTGYTEEDCDLMMFGRAAEGPAAEVYAYKSGRRVLDRGATEIQIHPDIPWLGATLDRWQLVDEGGEHWEGPLEMKTASGRKASEWTDHDAPIENEVQLQAQMASTSSKRGTICGLLWGNQWKWHDKDRNDDFLETAYPILEEFHQRVQRRDPPPPRSESCLPVVKRLYDVDDGETVTLGADIQTAVESLEAAKKKKSEVDKRIKTLEAEIRAALKWAEWGELPDGRFVHVPTYHRTGYEVEPTHYRQMRIVKTR